MSANKTLTLIFFVITMCLKFQVLAQGKIDLAKINFSEGIGGILKNVQGIHEGKLSGSQDMVSHGFDNDGSFTFAGIVPGHIELLSWNGKLAGYAFKIRTFIDQQKVAGFFKHKYAKAGVQTSKLMEVYRYRDDQVAAELRFVVEEKFNEGASGYLDVKSADFAKVFEQMTERQRLKN